MPAVSVFENPLYGIDGVLKRAVDLCRRYAANPEGWLVLTGEYGCGKTHLAAAIANQRAASGEPVLFIVVPDLLDHLRATFGPASQVRFDKRFEEAWQVLADSSW